VTAPAPDEACAAERAARLRAMGRVLHEAGSDETAEEAPGAAGQDTADSALRREVPPHHGG
jgi:hypothetical protein